MRRTSLYSAKARQTSMLRMKFLKDSSPRNRFATLLRAFPHLSTPADRFWNLGSSLRRLFMSNASKRVRARAPLILYGSGSDSDDGLFGSIVSCNNFNSPEKKKAKTTRPTVEHETGSSTNSDSDMVFKSYPAKARTPEKGRRSSRIQDLASTSPPPKGPVTYTTFSRNDVFGRWVFSEKPWGSGGSQLEVTLDGRTIVDNATFECSFQSSRDTNVKLCGYRVVKAERKKGYGTAVLQYILEQYKESGCKNVFVVNATGDGTRCYKRCGMVLDAVNNLTTCFEKSTPAENNLNSNDSDSSSYIQDPHGFYGHGSDASGDDTEDKNEDSDADNFQDSPGSEYGSHPGSDSSDSESDPELSDDDGDVLDPDHSTALSVPRARGTSVQGFAPARTGDERYPKSKDFEEMSDATWSVRHQKEGSHYGKMLNKRTGLAYTVALRRIPKAMLHLTRDSCLEALKDINCACQRNCNTILSVDQIEALRKPLYERCDCEVDVFDHIKARLEVTKHQYLLEGTKVCRKFYAAAFGVGERRMGTMRKNAEDGTRPRQKAKNSKPKWKMQDGPGTSKYDVAYAFWHMFFEENCQRPNDEIRLYPTTKSLGVVYAEYFTPWFDRQCKSSSNMTLSQNDKPSHTYWKSVRLHEDFKDVKKCKKHTHGRCGTCSELKKMLLDAFKTGAAEEEYKRRRRLHDEEVKAWRLLESTLSARAVASPESLLLLEYDDTVSIGFPHLGLRGIKNMNTHRSAVVPWLGVDKSSGQKEYVYTPKRANSKGTNRAITQLHAMVRRAKTDYTHPRHLARRLVCVADSASDNKNNVLFTYCTDLVQRGWFDVVELVFGAVGHTHNVVDACHKIHNQNVASYFAGDVGHFVRNYDKGFTKGTPSASYLQEILNWDKYYKPVMKKMAGFTNTREDNVAVRGLPARLHNLSLRAP